jgi:hypothetical protein
MAVTAMASSLGEEEAGEQDDRCVEIVDREVVRCPGVEAEEDNGDDGEGYD